MILTIWCLLILTVKSVQKFTQFTVGIGSHWDAEKNKRHRQVAAVVPLTSSKHFAPLRARVACKRKMPSLRTLGYMWTFSDLLTWPVVFRDTKSVLFTAAYSRERRAVFRVLGLLYCQEAYSVGLTKVKWEITRAVCSQGWWMGYCVHKKLSYRRETARQLSTWMEGEVG